MNNEFTNRERAEVLVQALPHIKRYNGKIVVIKYGGNAMIDENLKMQVMEDIALLWLIGVKVVLIHGGGPEISETMKSWAKRLSLSMASGSPTGRLWISFRWCWQARSTRPLSAWCR